MRMTIIVTVMFALLMAILVVSRDSLRPAHEADLQLDDLHADTPREELKERLGHVEFECTDDEAVEAGERACFAPITRADDFEADYLALFFDRDNLLAAINIVLDPEAHEANHQRLRERFGEPDQEIHDENVWLVWERSDHLLLTHKEPPERDAPALMWFRSADLMERLLPR